MFPPQKTVAAAAKEARGARKRLARPAGDFDASRYFRGDHDLGFYNTGTNPMRALAKQIHLAHRHQWGVSDAMAFADALIVDRYLEVKSIGIEVVARYRRDFAPALLARWKRWLADDYSTNWSTTDAMCAMLIGPLLLKHPHLARDMRASSKNRNMRVRRASIIALLPVVRARSQIGLGGRIAERPHPH